MDPTHMSQRSSDEDNGDFLQIFLRPLLKEEHSRQYDPDFKKSGNRLELEKKPLNRNTCLSGIVLEKLREQKQTVEIDKEKKMREIKVELSQMVNVSKVDSQVTDRNSQVEDITNQAEGMNLGETAEVGEEKGKAEQLDKEHEANVEKVLGLARDIEKIKNEKSHQQISASGWNRETLQNYIKRDNVDLVETLVSGRDSASGSQELHNDRFSSLKNGLVKCSRQLLDDHQHFSLDEDKVDEEKNGLKLWSLQFAKPMLMEQAVTFMVLEIIGAVCDLCDVRLKPEETLKKNDFPGARVDYALVYEGIIFGIVEVKTPKTMTDDAVAQLMISLMKLQLSHNDDRMQYIGILTDGFRFVLVSLQGDKFTFESTMNTEIPEINIYTAVTWEKLFELCEYLQSVISSVTANLPNIAKKISSP